MTEGMRLRVPGEVGKKWFGVNTKVIRLVGSDPKLLQSPVVQERDAEKMFRFLVNTLPHGTYTRLLAKVIGFRRRNDEAEELLKKKGRKKK